MRAAVLNISLLFFFTTFHSISAASLEYDLRKLKLKCCTPDQEPPSCSHQRIGQASCPAGTEPAEEDGWDCDPFCTEFTEALLLMSLGDIHAPATEAGLRLAVESTRPALAQCGHGDARRRRTASSARANLAVVVLTQRRGGGSHARVVLAGA